MRNTHSISDSPDSKWLIVLGAVLLATAFYGALGLKRFGDDWTFVYSAYEAVKSGITAFIFGRLSQHWSPLWHSFEVLNFYAVGWESDVFIRTVIILFQAMGLLAVFLLARYFKLGLIPTATAIIVLALHHSNAAAIYSFDTYSQCAADSLGWVGCVFFLRFLDDSCYRKSHWYILALLLLTASLLFKEQGLATAGIYIGFTLIRQWPYRKDGMLLQRFVGTIAPILVIVLIFSLARSVLGGVSLELSGPFRISPLKTPLNMAMILFALLTPFRTLE